MEKNNQKNIQELEEEYKKHLEEIVTDIEVSKNTADKLQIMYEEKLA